VRDEVWLIGWVLNLKRLATLLPQMQTAWALRSDRPWVPARRRIAHPPTFAGSRGSPRSPHETTRESLRQQPASAREARLNGAPIRALSSEETANTSPARAAATGPGAAEARSSGARPPTPWSAVRSVHRAPSMNLMIQGAEW